MSLVDGSSSRFAMLRTQEPPLSIYINPLKIGLMSPGD